MQRKREQEYMLCREKHKERQKSRVHIKPRERKRERERVRRRKKERKQDDYLFSIGNVKGREKCMRKPKEETEEYTCAPK